jgi:anti-sigma factor RsiW
MTDSDRRQTLLEAYRDGELGTFARWRVERWLRRDGAARRRLAELEALGALLREVDQERFAPDLWDGIRRRLPAPAIARPGPAPRPAEAPVWRRAAGYLVLGAAAAAAAALALVFAGEPAPPPEPSAPTGAVRWIDSRGHPMMVLRDDPGATIIWVAMRDS